MGGSSICDDWELSSPLGDVRTVVLVGRTGNGKSSTGNSLLGRKAFNSKSSSGSVTSTCELHTTVLENGQILNVIDTPGLFDFKAELERTGMEIVRCIGMANDGIHAVLMVLSVRTRFSREEECAIESLRSLFGSKINDYMIIVFTGGDDLEDSDETLDDYMGREDCPEPLKATLRMCGNRCILFDNRTKDAKKKSEQLKELLLLVDDVVCSNGKPYTNELFVEMKGATEIHYKSAEFSNLLGSSKEEISVFQEQFNKTYEEQLQRITEMVESKLRETIHRLEQQLAEEHEARLKAEAAAEEVRQLSIDQMRKLTENLERAEKETEMRLAEEREARVKVEAAAEEVRQQSMDQMRKLREDLKKADKEREELRRIAQEGKCVIL